MPGSETKFSDLPIEIQAEILKHASPRTLAGQRAFGKEAQAIMPEVWREKFKQHFPHHFAKLDEVTQNNFSHDWGKEFTKAYQADYAKLSEEHKLLFTLVKEEDLASLKQNNENLSQYMGKPSQDEEGFTICHWASKNQAILDYFFWDVYKKDILHTRYLYWAGVCNQVQ